LQKEEALIRSTNQELGEYELIRHPAHIANVWSAIETSLPKYWDKFVQGERKPSVGKKEAVANMLARVFGKSIADYEKEAPKYRQVFDPDALDEFRDDPNAFKQALSRDVPVIANTLRQRRTELKDWQRHFRMARANDLLEVFSNLLDFVKEWSDDHPAAQYHKFDKPASFELDPLDDDETMAIENVVGMGIKSIVIHHLDPERLPPRGRNGLYGLYFLSGRDPFGLPSQSSEFLMVNDINLASDGSMIMDQNYWYPYGVFSLYALRIYKWIDTKALSIEFKLDRSIRYVYVERFFESVCAQHTADLKTMRAQERFEVPA
jgi:hypothetical protein